MSQEGVDASSALNLTESYFYCTGRENKLIVDKGPVSTLKFITEWSQGEATTMNIRISSFEEEIDIKSDTPELSYLLPETLYTDDMFSISIYSNYLTHMSIQPQFSSERGLTLSIDVPYLYP